MRKRNRRVKFMTLLITGLVLLMVYCFWQNNSIVISSSDYYNANIPEAFEDYKIVQISDLHNTMFGENQRNLLDKVEKISPDMIVITGDLIDRRRYNLDTAMLFIEGAVKMAPVYFVAGNHEAWSGKWSEIEEALTSAGVVILNDKRVPISKGDSTIWIMGLSDPAFLSSESEGKMKTGEMQEYLEIWSSIEEFTILLSHRPELFDLYSENKMDLIFAGHAHGGQFRLPLIGGIYSPNQGLFPEYTSGEYVHGGSTMFVSRGMGNSVMPIRINNRPEIVEVTLKNEKG